jgi:trehalose 6-phosphate phosphatase
MRARDLLAAGARPVLQELALPGTLVVLDFDGTLSRIVRDPAAARLAAGTRRVLEEAARLFRVAVLSGRAVADVRSRLEGIPIEWIVGSHGVEWPGSPVPLAWRRLVEGWRQVLSPRLARLEGVELEDKGLSLSIHWRKARDPRAAGAAALRASLRLPGAAVIPGKRVLNVVPATAGDKGTALRRLVAESGCERVLFMGDDETDEAGFRERLPGSVMVRVGGSRGTAAGFRVERRADVDRVLARLVTLRRERLRRRAPG